jgi:hypothetical protein
LDDALDLIDDTICYDKEFHKFALDNYGVFLSYDDKNNMFYFGKWKIIILIIVSVDNKANQTLHNIIDKFVYSFTSSVCMSKSR